jgi:putative restriction endonuclease
MSLSSIKSPQSILAAVQEHDRIGRDAFLAKYGYQGARSYFLVIDGKRYPSKAIVGAAHGYEYPSLGPLTPGDFSGGRLTVQKKLEQLGFEVDVSKDVATAAELEYRHKMWAGLIQQGGPLGVLPGVLRDLGIYGGAQGIWVDKLRTGPLTSDQTGVTVGLLHTGSAYPDDISEDGVIYHYPKTARPPGRDANEISATKAAGTLSLPVFVITYPEPNSPLRNVHLGWIEGWDDATSVFLVSYQQQQPEILLVAPQLDNEPFVGEDRRQRPKGLVPMRPGQARFKLQVFQRYGAKCAVCNIALPELLDAVHLRSVGDHGSNDPRNGLVLCASHHRAFDSGLFFIEPETLMLQYRRSGIDAQALGITRHDIRHLPRQPHPSALQWLWSKQGVNLS